jgi:hypothetical protein
MADQKDYVTIQIPGLQDIIRIPALDTPEYKAQRIQRMRAASSPLPDLIKWIPDWINFLDDAQDILITALTLGKLFAPKILGRAIPYVGGALVANDLLNIINAFLGTATGSGFPKRDILETFKRFKVDRASRITAGSLFLSKRTAWVPFLLQAGQVLYNATGWGLQLGTIFGAMSDSVFSLFAAAQGKQVRIVPPPTEDIYDKAFRFLSQSWLFPYMAPALNYDDLKQGTAGFYASIGLIYDAQRPQPSDAIVDAYAAQNYPGWQVTNPNSVAALKDEGFTDADLTQRPQYYEQFASSMAQACQSSIAFDPNLTRTIAEKMPATTEAGDVQTMTGQAASDAWDVYSAQPNALDWIHSPYERLMSRMWHENAFPPWYIEPCSVPVNQFTVAYLPDSDQFLNPLPRSCRNIVWVVQIRNPASGDLQIKVIDPWRMPRWYPPEFDDQTYQLIWFLEIALSVACGKITQFPFVAPHDGATVEILEGRFSAATGKKIPLRIASVLVWGNAWSKPLNANQVIFPKQKPIPFCVIDNATSWPKLAGIQPETEQLASVRNLMPRPGQLPNRIEADYRGRGTALWNGGDAPPPESPW